MKLKNVFAILSILAIVASGKLFAQEEVKRILDEYQMRKKICEEIKCEGLETEAAIKCLQEVRACLDKLQKDLSSWAEAKINEIQSKLDELQKEKKTLKNQIDYLWAQLEKTEIETRVIQERINFLNFEISKREKEIENIKNDIQKQEKEIAGLSENLKRTLRAIYEYDHLNILAITIFKDSISDFFNEIYFLEKIQKDLTANLNKVKTRKKILEDRKKNLDEEVGNLQKSRQEVLLKAEILNRKLVELENLKKEKTVLLEITRGDEEEYQRLLAIIEAQKREFLAELSALSQARQAEIDVLVEQYGGRVEGSLFGSYYYFAQDEGPWADEDINNIPPPLGGKMRQYGCAITSAAMVLKYYGKDVNPGILAKDSRIFEGILIKFPALNLYQLSCQKGCYPEDNINWQEVDFYLNQGKPVILMIKTNTGATHFIVAIGKIREKYMVFDPIYSVSRGKAVDLNVSIENIKALPNVTDAQVTRMILF